MRGLVGKEKAHGVDKDGRERKVRRGEEEVVQGEGERARRLRLRNERKEREGMQEKEELNIPLMQHEEVWGVEAGVEGGPLRIPGLFAGMGIDEEPSESFEGSDEEQGMEEEAEEDAEMDEEKNEKEEEEDENSIVAIIKNRQATVQQSVKSTPLGIIVRELKQHTRKEYTDSDTLSMLYRMLKKGKIKKSGGNWELPQPPSATSS
eukprot:GHVS01009503.1.p1 GENE.GHVS01009503.1~~GHVS01009503.1.p1  ORF type:complete len:206 (+),score=58.72 GHVS01009503.1:2-619(+)